MSAQQDAPWYKDAVIYQLHVKSFFDANEDGTGDFAGLISKLDYITDLGATAIWLLPFYPSPRRDDGYDIADYRGVHPDYGAMSDVRRFIREAHRRDLRVITELVVNHTSDQHPWFRRARQAPRGSRARDFYVWSDTAEAYRDARIIFIDSEESNWTWDAVAQQYFWHRFYSHQPDLNYDNPAVLREIISVLRFWLDAGVDGLRLDAVPYLIERDGTSCENLPETHAVLRRIRAETERLYPHCMLLAEANQWPEDAAEYFGEGDECHMAFHFPLMPRMYMAIAREDRYPITNILRQTPDIPDRCQWAIFLRNHDELTLEMVSDRDRDYLWRCYAEDPRARINLGIRRRLAPLVGRDRRRVELLNALLLSMPGTPIIYYGDEIGMGDNLYLGDRDGVRTPMQWSSDRNGGFSRADPAALVLPTVMDPLYGYQTVNVESQTRDPHSLLNWTKRMLTIRRGHLAFSRGTFRLLTPANRRILTYLREYHAGDAEPQSVLCVMNLAGSAQAVELDLHAFQGCVPTELTGGSRFPRIEERGYALTLAPYGFYWFSLTPAHPHSEPAPLEEDWPELPTVVIRESLSELMGGRLSTLLNGEILPRFLPGHRWLRTAEAEQAAAGQVALEYVVPLGADGELLALSEVRINESCWQLPLGYHEESLDHPVPLAATLSRLRRGAMEGLLTDALYAHGFAHAVVEQVRARQRLPLPAGQICFEPGPGDVLPGLSGYEQVTVAGGEQSNSTLLIGQRLTLKLYRAVQSGVHPEAEMLRCLSRAGFDAVAPLAGEVWRENEDGTPHSLMILQQYVPHEGDAWHWTLERLGQAVEQMLEDETQPLPAVPQGLSRLAEQLGRRLGDLHSVLARTDVKDDAFGVTHWDAAEVRERGHDIATEVRKALDALREHQTTLPPDAVALVHGLLGHNASLSRYILGLAAETVGGACFRVHGDLHLGQVLVTQTGVCFIDFEGEPLRSLAQRRQRQSPLKDVTGVLRSFCYAAATVERQALTQPSTPDRVRRVQAFCQAYQGQSRATFLQAYCTAAARLPHTWQHPGGEQAALALHGIEKAAYEVLYEARHRPEWVGIPLHGLATLLQPAIQGGPSHD